MIAGGVFRVDFQRNAEKTMTVHEVSRSWAEALCASIPGAVGLKPMGIVWDYHKYIGICNQEFAILYFGC